MPIICRTEITALSGKEHQAKEAVSGMTQPLDGRMFGRF